jgi:hypothetical protein
MSAAAPLPPRLNPADYTLRVATDAQEEAHWRAQFVPWNRGRTYEVSEVCKLRYEADAMQRVPAPASTR